MIKLLSLNSVSKKLLFILMSVALISVLIVSFLLSAYEFKTAQKDQQSNLDTLIKVLSPSITAAVLFEDNESIQELINPILLRSDMVSVLVNNAQGEKVASANNDNKVLYADEHLTQVTAPLALDGITYGELIIVVDDSYIHDRIGFYGYFIVIALALTFGVSLFVSLCLRQRFLAPILHLAQVAKKVTDSNDYSQRAQTLSKDEFGQLTNHFNSMLQTIEQRDRVLEQKVQQRTQELESANSQLHEFAYIDGLTDLPNRRYFYEKLQSLLNLPQQKFALIFIDLDGFKEVNDNLGHDYGDILLSQVAKRLKNCVRANDTVARLGGDEFTLIIEGVDDHLRASQLAQTLKESLMQCISIKDEEAYVSGSIGITFYPADGDTVDLLVKHADQAMYLAKENGRNRYEFFSLNMEAEAKQKHDLIEELRMAIALQQFEIYYQPIFCCNTQRVVQVEALIRWHHPQKGLLVSMDFIPIAESYGLISTIDDWVREQVVSDVSQWYQQTGKVMPVSVNVSPLEIDLQSHWVDKWILNYTKYNLPANAISLEITENALMDTSDKAQQQLQQLSNHGINMTIDDFGVGYSSLAYLLRLKVNTLKIDKVFVQDIVDNESSLSLVRAIISMAQNLNINVVVQGVENEQQLKILHQYHCEYLQGEYLAPPMTKADFEQRFLGFPSQTALAHQSQS
ncbi:bifunctional diguanylate cyclase/phosphodiesterase [Shewanella aestuarii]|uniref:EAL domain-containing protein n=1 Tax=Shewanella aestuarii TaxID=1028752 RepID=A0A6G9QQ10_9GAMM|nr:EAL domain-containing protein [Shewanella aestuarii]QIR15901.1 EAL domain-containing protein [Shewanella aestuarii]